MLTLDEDFKTILGQMR